MGTFLWMTLTKRSVSDRKAKPIEPWGVQSLLGCREAKQKPIQLRDEAYYAVRQSMGSVFFSIESTAKTATLYAFLNSSHQSTSS